jgi:hypothetical protein
MGIRGAFTVPPKKQHNFSAGFLTNLFIVAQPRVVCNPLGELWECSCGAELPHQSAFMYAGDLSRHFSPRGEFCTEYLGTHKKPSKDFRNWRLYRAKHEPQTKVEASTPLIRA